MRTLVCIPLLVAAHAASAQNITPRVLVGSNYCHEVTLTGTWTIDARVDETTLMEFRGGSGELEYRLAGLDSVLVSFYTVKYEGLTKSRVYSSKKILLPLKGANAGRAATDQQWEEARTVVRSRAPAFSEPPAVPPGQDAVIHFRGFEFAATAHLYPPFFAAAPGGDWIAALSWKGSIAGELEFEQTRGSMYLDVYRVASGEKTIQVQFDFRDTDPDGILPHAVWISDRHFVFPINRLKTRLMVCDVGPLQDSSGTVWDLVSKDAEILGLREESTTNDVAGTLGRLALHIGVRVPEAGRYRFTASVENERGRTASRFEEIELSAGTNQIKYGVDPTRDANGVLKVRNVTLERVIGQVKTQVARRDLLGTIGPYIMIAPQWEARRKALNVINELRRDSVVKFPGFTPSPLTTRSLTGKVENLTDPPKAGSKVDTLRLRVAVPPVAGQCTWLATLESGGKFLISASTHVNSQAPPEAVLFEFRTTSIFPEPPDGEIRLSKMNVACREGKASWDHDFDQFPVSVIPGLRVSMLQLGTDPSATFTGENRIEFLDTNHDGKYEAIKVTVGFKSDWKCKVTATYKDSIGSRHGLGAALYDPRDGSKGVVFYIAFVHTYTSGEHSLENFYVSYESSDGLFRPAAYDKSFRLPLGKFTSEQFQPPFELSFESEQPTLDDGALVYRINCTPRWTLDLPIEFSAWPDIPATGISLDPPRGACNEHATTLRFKPFPDAPPLAYNVTVVGTVANTDITNFAGTKWVKPAVPEILGVLPNSGSGKGGSFRVAGDDLSSSVPKTELLFNDAEEITHACHITITYSLLALTDDDGQSAKVSEDPKWPSIANSQCAIEKEQYSDRVQVTFKPAFSGRKTIYARAWNGVGATSGWINQGAWIVSQNEPPVPISASPYLGTADHETFTFAFADPNGGADIDKLEAVIAFDPSDEQTCHLIVDRSAAQFSLAGGVSVPLGSAETINPQCAVANVHVVEERGRMLRLSAGVRFTPAFRGRRNIFLRVADRSKLESRWLWAGSWDVR
jgi:hypothetical protein